MPTIVYKRKELYKRVWSKPIMKLAAEDGISGRGLAKICEKLDIPRPPRGYWAKVQAGQKPKRKKLPRLKNGTPTVHERWSPTEDEQEPLSDETHVLLDTAARLNRVVVTEELVEPHPVLEASLPRLRAKRPRSLENTSRLALPVRTIEIRERSIRVMDAVLKTLSTLGISATVKKRKKVVETNRRGEEVEKFEPSKTVAHILGFDIQFGIEEQTDSIRTTHQSAFRERLGMSPKVYYHSNPNGSLALRIYSSGGPRSTWADGKKQRIEHCINSFIVGLIKTGEAMRLRQHRQEEARLASIERERQWREDRRRAAHEKKLVDDLETRLDGFERAEKLRRYLNAFRTRQEEAPERHPDWFEWAEQRVAKLEAQAFEKELPTTNLPEDPWKDW